MERVDANQNTARRANLDDLPALKGLWDIARLPVAELEKHLTEFQVITRPDGILLGAIALRVAGHQGLVHSEAFYQPEQEERYRPLLWERLQMVARNHILTRLWTREGAPFWRQCGFNPATEEDLKRLPPALGNTRAGWMTLALHQESPATVAAQQQLELYQAAQREASEQILRQAQRLKWVAGLIALAFFVGAAVLLVVILQHHQVRTSP